MIFAKWTVCFLLFAGLCASVRAEDSPAVVSNIKVLSDKVEDVSSIEAMEKSIFKEGMTDAQKAVALFMTIVKFRHFEPTPQEFSGLSADSVTDAIKLFNVYGYGSAQGAMPQLARTYKYDCRAYTLTAWGVAPELFFDKSWHYMDPVMLAYFLKPDGTIAGVEEISKDVLAFYEKHPELKIKDRSQKVAALQKFVHDPGVAQGPELLRNSPTMEKNGNFWFNYFGWYTSMLLFDGSDKTPFLYEESYTQGYRVNIQLRKGEKLARNWSNTGLHINQDGGSAPQLLNAETGKGVLYYTPKMGDLSNGRVGNGTLVYDAPLKDASFKSALLSAENVAFSPAAAAPVQIQDASKPGSFVLRMPSSYVYLSGALNYETTGGEVAVSISTNNGLDWKEIGKAAAAGPQTIDLKPFVMRQYDYRLKFTLSNKDAGVKALKITHDIQHSQRALPALDTGDNKITFSAGPQEGTVTVEGTGKKFKDKRPTYEDFHVEIKNALKENLDQWGTICPGGQCDVIIPIETPGDMTRIRTSCFYRSTDKASAWDIQVSYDNGATYKSIQKATGPARFDSRYVTTGGGDIPAGTKKALVKYSGTGGLVLFDFRVDADYKEPHGGYKPVKVTYTWTENGQEKTDVHVAAQENETYTIKCATKPKMKAIVLELAE